MMSLDTPTGTRGARQPGASSPIAKWVARLMGRQHRRAGYKFQGMDVLFLTTTGRKSGQPHENAVSWYADGDDAWLIVASAGGSAGNPAWYLNMAAHPDQVWIELPDRKLQVTPEQLAGERREEAWQRITTAQPRFAKYQTKTDRMLPVIRLVPADASDTQPSDTDASDTRPSNAQPSDAQPSDAQPRDAQPSDAQPSDAQPSDAQPSDAQPSDAQPGDAGTSDEPQQPSEAP